MNFDDIYLKPAPISFVGSRNDTDTSTVLCGQRLSIPLISSNMTSVYSTEQADKIHDFGTQAVVHRFTSIEENVKLFQEGQRNGSSPWVSVGVSMDEFKRAEALIDAGAKVLVLEVANASHVSCIEQYKRLRTIYKVPIVVGTFATGEQIEAFVEHAGSAPDAVLVGIGTGDACLTGREVTGINIPAVHTILSTVKVGIPVILSGGVSKPADFIKALSLGATAVMSGKIFSACYESGAKGFDKIDDQYVKNHSGSPQYKYYYGSASQDAYLEQGKVAKYRVVEGEGKMIKASGTTEEMLLRYQNSLRSAMTYMNSYNLDEFRKNVKWGIKNVLE